MAFPSKNVKKYTRYALNGLLVTGMIFVTGFLSFTGMLVLNDSIYFAIAAFVLAGGIEGEVYAQNINTSLLKLFTGDYWEDVIIERTLDKLLENTKDFSSNPFLNDYKKQKAYVEMLEEEEDASKALELKNARRSLKYMRRYFKDFILDESEFPASPDPVRQPFHAELKAALAKLGEDGTREALREQISSKKFYSRLAWVLNIGAGISCALVGLEVAQSSITVLALHFGIVISGAAMSASVFGLAIVGAIGYVMLIHNTITDMLKNETLREWSKNISDFFERRADEATKEPENLRNYLLRVVSGALGVAIVVGLGIFATVATAGTWWYAAKAGAKMIPGIASIADGIRSIAVSLMAITTLVFNIKNSLESLKELVKISITKSYQAARNVINKYFKLENILQILNPFRFVANLISIPFRLAAFFLHLVCMGIMMDLLYGVPPIVTTLLGTANEGIQDVHYFISEGEDEHHHHHHHSHETYDIQLLAQLATGTSLKNTFVITKATPRLIQFDKHGHEKEILNEAELRAALTSLNLEHYLVETVNPRSIKAELNTDQLNKLNKIIHEKTAHHHEHPHEPHEHSHHDHTHADLAGKLLLFVLAPLYMLAAAWDWAASQLNSGKKPVLTVDEALDKAFVGLPRKKAHIEKPVISSAWKSFEKQARITKTINNEVFVCSEEDKKLLLELDAFLNKQEALFTTPGETPGEQKSEALVTPGGPLKEGDTEVALTSGETSGEPESLTPTSTSNSPAYITNGKFNKSAFFDSIADKNPQTRELFEKFITISESYNATSTPPARVAYHI